MGAKFGLPYKWYWDEAKIYWFAHKMILERTIIPELFRRGSPVIYFESGIMLLLGLGTKLMVYLGIAGETIAEIAESFDLYVPAWPISTQFINYSLYLGRIAQGLLTGITSMGVYYLSKEVFGRRAIGVLAAAINAVLYIQISHSWLLLMDNLGYPLVLLVVIIALRYYHTGSGWLFFLIGFLTSLTISTKNSLASIIVLPFVAFILREIVHNKDPNAAIFSRRNPSPSWPRKAAIVTLVICLISLFLFAEYLVAKYLPPDMGTYFREILSLRQFVAIIVVMASILIFAGLIFRKTIIEWGSLLITKIPAKNLHHIVYLFLGLIFSGIIFNLGLFFKTDAYINQILFQSGIYFGGEYGGSVSSGISMIYWIVEYFSIEGLGPVFAVFACLGIVFLWLEPLKNKSDQFIRIIFIFFPVVYLFSYSFTHIFILRNFLPLTPFLSILSAFGCWKTVSLVDRFIFSKWISRKNAKTVEVLIIIFFYAIGAYHHIQLFDEMAPISSKPDTRTDAISWISTQEVFEDKIILLDLDLGFSPIELQDWDSDYILQEVNLDHKSIQHYQELGVNIIVTSHRKMDKDDEKDIKAHEQRKVNNSPIIYFFDKYRERILEESLLDVNISETQSLSLLVEFTKPGHKSVLGTDFDLLYPTRVVMLTEKEGSVPVIINPDIVVYWLND